MMIGDEGQNSSWSSCFLDNSAQLVPTFLSKYWQKHKKIRVLWQWFVLFTALMCYDAIFNLLKRVTDGSFLFLYKMLVFLLPTLYLGVQIGVPKIRYTDLTSPVDQALSALKSFISICVECRKLCRKICQQKMGNLHANRLSEKPFTFCGVDMFGPFLVKDGWKIQKRYGAIDT